MRPPSCVRYGRARLWFRVPFSTVYFTCVYIFYFYLLIVFLYFFISVFFAWNLLVYLGFALLVAGDVIYAVFV